ncbi:nck-associated protein 1 homolog [Schistocerca gregaria]|uniref:nck-associated protein 1 homolog n=1 Tax=Schistocerca gregaria TaxID=7010 RepID=UPI00211EC7A2|nr:nck-associated protein 1 homolog [Schistocerca gregaria]
MKKRIVEQAWLQGQERPNYSGFSKDDLILRQPSALYHRVFLLIQEYQYFDYFVNLNMPALVKNVIQSYLAPSSQFQNRKAQGSTLTDAVTSWYANSFFKQRCTSPIVSARYLSMRRVFFTTPHYTFKVERYIESNELNALVRLLGPCGIRHLDCAMLDCTVQQIRVLLDAFKLMKPQLKTINNSELYSTHVQVLKTLKSSTYIREFIISAISLGRILTYRRMIYDALEDVQHQVVPHIYQSLKNTCQQALQMSGSNADISELRSLAQDAGVRIMGDQVLTDAISAAIKTDKERYSLLPLAFVVSLFSSSEWRDANFDPVTQSFDNNIHLVARAIIDTFWFFSSIQKTGRQEYFENQFIFFVGKSTTMLAYLIADQKLEKAVPKEFINILIFLDLFVKLIPLSFRRRVKWHLPYALIRLARTTSKKKKTS